MPYGCKIPVKFYKATKKVWLMVGAKTELEPAHRQIGGEGTRGADICDNLSTQHQRPE